MSISFLRKLGLAAVLAWARFAQAGPSELNYQGVVLDSSGNGVTGTRAMTLKLYDAAIGGNLLYTENVGNVAVNKGVYSFNFGTNGTGNPKITETVTVADGTSTTFQKILANTNVVTGSVSVSDGTYTWDQVNGSSDGGVNFDASYSTSLRRITVNYYNGPPATGKVLKVTYRSPSAGLTGILASENDSWLEVAVNGATQSPRQKFLAVPFALRAGSVEGSTYQETVEVDLPIKRFNTKNNVGSNIYSDFNTPLPWGFGDKSSPPGFYELMYDFPFYVKEIISVTVVYSVLKNTWYSGTSNTGRVDFSLLNSQNENLQTLSFPRTEASSVSRVIPVNRTVPSGEQYRIYFTIKSAQDGSWGDGYGGGSIISVITKVRVPKSMGFQ
jgi:hypothetical protein